MKEDIKKNGKLFHAHELENLILLKWQCHPKQSADAMQSLSTHNSTFAEIEKTILKFIWNCKGFLS